MDTFIEFISNYSYLAVFLGTLVWGETIMIAAGFIASLQTIELNIYLVMLFGALGTLVADNFWYLIGHFGKKGSRFLEKYESYAKRKPKFIEKIKIKFNDHSGKTIFFSKFVYGTRIVALITAGVVGMKYRKFIIANFLSVIVWSVVMALVGFYLGEGYEQIKQYTQWAEYILLAAVIAFIVIRVIIYLVRSKKKKKLSQTHVEG